MDAYDADLPSGQTAWVKTFGDPATKSFTGEGLATVGSQRGWRCGTRRALSSFNLGAAFDTAAGTSYLAGTFAGSVDVAGTVLTSSGKSDVYVAKLSATQAVAFPLDRVPVMRYIQL